MRGFSQSGGAYFIIIASLDGMLHSYTGSAMPLKPATDYAPGLSPGVAAGAVGPGKLIRDMGKSVVLGGITYRKFQVVQTPSPAGAGGQMGVAPEYFSFYLEVGREGAGSSPVPIARYF